MKKSLLFLTFLLLVCSINIFADVWQKDVFDSTGTATGINCAIALDSRGYPHISYADLDNMFLKYAYYDGTNWNIRTLDSFGITGLHTSIALDADDNPHISYTAQVNVLHYIFQDDTGWVNMEIDSGIYSTMQGFRTSIELDHNEMPHIAWTLDTAGAIMYSVYDGDNWNTEMVQDITMSYYVSLILKDDSIPYIGYHILDSSITRDTLRIAYQEPGKAGWEFADVDDDICPSGVFYHSFDMDSEGNCYFAYETTYMPGMPCMSMGDKKIAKFDGSSWSYETVPKPTSDPYDVYPTLPLYLKMDQNNNPAFLADTILYWKKDGSTWSYYGLGNQMGSNGVAVYQQLIFDEFNYPNMVFGQPWTVYYKMYPGDPQILVPETSHIYTENYATWNCVIQNQGEAPVIIDSLKFKKDNGIFELIIDPSPFYIHSMQSDSIAIRFMPEEEITYYDTLLIYNNDSSNSIVEVTLEGTGVFDEFLSDLTVFIKDCYASPEYHALNYDQPVQQASLSLYQGGELKYGPVLSDFVGYALMSNILEGFYDAEIRKIVSLPRDDGKPEDTLIYTTPMIIDTGLNVYTLVLPESLMVQSYQWVYDLSNMEYDEMTYVYAAESYSTENIRDVLDSWLPALDSVKIESASRLILAQEMFNRMFPPERSLGRKGLEGISDMLHYVIKATEGEGGWLMKLWKVVKIIWNLYAGDKVAALMEIMQFLMEYIVIEIIDGVIDRVGDELPCVQDPFSGADLICGKEIIKAAWKDIKAEYSTWQLPEWEDEDGPENSWNHVKGLVYTKAKAAFIQGVYINILTNPQLDDAREYAENLDYSSDFATASETSYDDITAIKYDADTYNDIAGNFLLQADLLGKTVMILTAIGEFLPTPGWLETVKTACMYAAIGTAATATGVAFGGFFSIPEDMDDVIPVIYHPELKKMQLERQYDPELPTAKANMQLINTIKRKIEKSAGEYDSVLTVVEGHIQSHEIEDAIFTYDDLLMADVNFVNTMEISSAPAFAVAHALYDSIPGFSNLYDGYITDGSAAAMTRLFSYISLIQLPGDSSQNMKDYILAHLDTVSINNQEWTGTASELLDSLFGVEIPGIIAASVASQDKYGLKQDDTATVTVRLQNVGAVTADSVWISFEVNDALGLLTRNDSVYVGSLAPLEESQEYQWSVVVYDTTFGAGIWTAEVFSSNAKNYSPDGYFKVATEPMVDAEEDGPDAGIYPDNFVLKQNSPNPFNAVTKIEFELPRRAHVKLEIFNTLGQRVTILADEEMVAGKHTVNWDADDYASGIYFYRLRTNNYEETKKMTLLK